DGAPEDAVVGAVEIRFGDDVADAIPGRIAEQQATQHGLLRLHRVGRQAQGFDLGVAGNGTGKAVGAGRCWHLLLSPVGGLRRSLAPPPAACTQSVPTDLWIQRINLWKSCVQSVAIVVLAVHEFSVAGSSLNEPAERCSDAEKGL